MEQETQGFVKDLFSIKNHDLYRAVEDLIKDSEGNGTYYTLLILSSIIIAAGALLANSAILIGGMLVTPVLTPILLISLGVVSAKPMVIQRAGILVLKSFGIIFCISFIAALMFGVPSDSEFFDVTLFNDSLRAAFLYFIVAFVSGISATFAWIRKEISGTLPGISIAVSLVPPAALVGIWLAVFDLERMRFFFLILLFNLVGILLGSMIVISLLRGYRSGGVIEHTVAEQDAEKQGR